MRTALASAGGDGLDSGRTLAAIVPNDVTNIAECWVYVGVGGDVKVIAAGDTVAVTLKNVPTGSLLPIRVTRVYAIGTNATDLVAVR